MKKLIYTLSIIGLMASCSQNASTDTAGEEAPEAAVEQAGAG